MVKQVYARIVEQGMGLEQKLHALRKNLPQSVRDKLDTLADDTVTLMRAYAPYRKGTLRSSINKHKGEDSGGKHSWIIGPDLEKTKRSYMSYAIPQEKGYIPHLVPLPYITQDAKQQYPIIMSGVFNRGKKQGGYRDFRVVSKHTPYVEPTLRVMREKTPKQIDDAVHRAIIQSGFSRGRMGPIKPRI